MAKLGKGTISRIGMESVESLGFGQGIKFKRMTEKRFWERWSTEQYGKWKAATGLAIGGQEAQAGPDILKFIKKHDPSNTSGAVKDALDIMQKLQDGATKPQDLFSSIQPLKNILGGGLYSKMKAAGASAKASEKVSQPPQEDDQEPEQNEDIIALLIAAAIALCEDDDKIIVAELLDKAEIKLIRDAFYNLGTYTSAKADMPTKFVESINKLMPIFRLKVGIGALVS